jgi:hypothetical protein
VEEILQTIDRLGIVKIKHLQQIHNLKSYRNTCRIISSHLKPFINETFYQKEKVMTLNKRGREFIGTDSSEMKPGPQSIHSLLRNEVYIYFKCPGDWKNEYAIKTVSNPHINSGIIFNGLNLSGEKKLFADAAFKRNGYLHLIEVDNERKMLDNKKKIETYYEILPKYQNENPVVYFFTETVNRKHQLQEWLNGIKSHVLTFEEIR